MLGATDYAGIAAVITSIFGGIIGIITLYRTTQVHTEVKNPNGSTTGQAVEEVHAALSTPPTAQGTVAEITADTNKAVQDIKTVLSGEQTGGGAAPPPQGG